MSWVPSGHTSSFTCVRLEMQKLVFQWKNLNLWTMNGYIFRINTVWGMFKVHEYDHTHFCVHVKPKKRPKNDSLARQTLKATDLKHCMHTQLHLGVARAGSLLATPLPIGV